MLVQRIQGKLDGFIWNLEENGAGGLAGVSLSFVIKYQAKVARMSETNANARCRAKV
jgi:hypothetical protein